MNGINGGSPGRPTFALDDEPISPTALSSPWDHLSSVSLTPGVTVVEENGRSSDQVQTAECSISVFSQLPPEVIQRILWAVDANGFASLCFINRAWYQESQKLELYAHHLSRCPSYALTNNVITGPFRKNDLLRLKTKFAAEVRRNLFDAYLRPRETHISLVSVNANSSAAFPGGEAFRFEYSPNGRTLLALSSSRIYVLDATTDSVVVKRELKTLRRPLSASITDDGSLLAVLSSKHQANIYALNPGSPVKHLQVIVLDNPPRTIALAHEGTVLAAAYEGGIEVFSLAANAMSTDRRAVRSEAVDSLTFSGDGSMLVGSSQDLEEPNAVVVTAPFYTENDPNITSREIHSRMWTTQILFPQISSTVSHAALFPGHSEGDTYWLFAYDHTLMSFRAVRTDDTRTGVAYFLSPATSRRFSFPSPSIAPSVTACGTLAVAGFYGIGLSLYGVPERLDVSPDMGSVVERNEKRSHGRMALTSATGHAEPLMAYSPSISGSSEEIEEDSLAGKVDWRQSLFVKCKAIRSIDGFTCAKWVERPDDQQCAYTGKRLIVTAPGGVNKFAEDLGEENMPVDGSRICLLDFDYGPSTLEHREITIEVGNNEAELLTEQMGDLDIEVAMERRRTVRTSMIGPTVRTSLGRSATAASPPSQFHMEDTARRGSASQPASPVEDPLSPYSRSSGLSRSHTASGFQQARFPPRPPLGQPSFADSAHGGWNRTNGARGSTSSWESPPPPYPNHVEYYAPHYTHNMQGTWHSNLLPNPSLANGYTPSTTQWQPYHDIPRTQTAPPSSQQTSPGLREPFRQSTTLDGMMTSEAAPSSQRQMTQYGNVPRSPRPFATPERSLQTVQEFTNPQTQPVRSDSIPTQSIVSPISDTDSYYNRARPSSHVDSSPEGTLGLRSTITHPLNPPMPDAHIYQRDQSPTQSSPTVVRTDERLSLTGANLQNRLNHPVPPVPGTVRSSQSSTTTSQQHPSVTAPMSSDQFVPAAPTADQLANLSRRDQQRLPSILTAGHKSATKDFGGVPPSPPRGAWGAAGVPGSPSFNRAIASPNGLSRSSSKTSQRSIHVSQSVPNLHSQRPAYGRLDTIESVNSAFVQVERERSHSVVDTAIQPDPNSFGTVRKIVTDPALEQKGKKAKRKKDDSGEPKQKKGSRCVVM